MLKVDRRPWIVSSVTVGISEPLCFWDCHILPWSISKAKWCGLQQSIISASTHSLQQKWKEYYNQTEGTLNIHGYFFIPIRLKKCKAVRAEDDILKFHEHLKIFRGDKNSNVMLSWNDFIINKQKEGHTNLSGCRLLERLFSAVDLNCILIAGRCSDSSWPEASVGREPLTERFEVITIRM